MSSEGIIYEEDLVSRIRDLIDGYSKDSILKEYLQNADDSGATELIVTYDSRIHQHLNNTDYEYAMGPALLLYNNSSFSDNDFKNIVKISAQGKSEDANSTGRFGQGFSSSFSISDHPSFISSSRAYWFDVLRKAVSQNKTGSIQAWKEESFNEIAVWLNTFKVADEENDQFHGTIFRLPLRNKKTAAESKISNEIFTHDDFLKWCDEWKNSADSLLFLRHVHRLLLQEISEDGKIIKHLEISTENSEEINNINDSIQKEFNGSLLNICNNWKINKNNLPLYKYKHNFNISYLDKEKGVHLAEQETWAVVNGLFRGDNDCLIDQAIKVLNISPNPRKVLPWAGVAIALDENGKIQKQQKKKFFTFLPLPVKSNHPIHIHGWFDLNPKRTEITHDGEGEDKEILIEWNQRLMKKAVGKAWALLVDYIKDESSLNSYYGLWAKNNDNELEQYLIEGFYQEISKLQSFFCLYRDEENWKTPGEDIYFFKKIKNENLLDAFKEHFAVIKPVPTQYIVDSMSDVGVELNEITPGFIRNNLEKMSNGIEFPVALSEIPIAMLAKRSWFLEILAYCADEGKDYTLIDGLPLELTLNQKIYKIGINTLFDETPNLKLFQNNENIFLDIEIAKLIKGIDIFFLPDSWLQENLINIISVLKVYIDEFELTREWIQYFINYLSNVNKSEIDDSIDGLKTLSVVYQENGEYGRLESNVCENSPVIVRHEDLNENIKYLKEIGMNLVHPDYIDIYRPILKHRGLITQLSPKSLSEHLLMLNDYSFFKNSDCREFLVDLLASDTQWYLELGEDEKEKLFSIPFIQTENDTLYALSTSKKLFLPTDFEPPKHIKNLDGEYELVRCIDSRHHAMFKEMGIEEQSSTNYLNDIIIPFIESSPDIEERNNVLKWLAIEWENLTNKIDEIKKFSLIQKLCRAKIIPDKLNGELESIEHFYHPSFFSQLPIVLQDKEFSPIEFVNKKEQESWEKFLTVLGVSTKIIPQHIVTKVEKIIADSNRTDAIELLNYISNKFEEFVELRYKSKPLFEYLKNLAWYPTEKPLGIIRPTKEYTLLGYSKDLILHEDTKIAGGAHYSLNKEIKLGKKDANGEYSKKEMANELGFIAYLPLISALDSFRQLIRLETSSRKINDKILTYAIEFYKYIGRIGRTKEIHIPIDIKEKSIRLYDKWIPSKNVFQYKITLSGIYDWNSLVDNEQGSDLQTGLKLLGVEEKPSNDFLVSHLKSLPINEKLEKHYLRDAKAILRELQNDVDGFFDDELPLLSQNDRLIEHSNLYINDLPAYKNAKEKNEDLMFCQVQFDLLAKRLGVKSLTENVEPVLNIKDSEFISANELSENFRLDNYINRYPFKNAVLRLYYHEGKLKKEEINHESLVSILPENIQFSSKLVISYQIADTWVFTDTTASTFEEKIKGILYILDQDDIEDMCDSLSRYICNAGNLSTDSLMIVDRILRKKMTKSQINDFMDKKNIKSLPEQLDFIDDFSIYEQNEQKSSDWEMDGIINNIDGYKEIEPTFLTEESLESKEYSDSILPKTNYTNPKEATNPDTFCKKAENDADIVPPVIAKTETGTKEHQLTEKANVEPISSNELKFSGTEIPPPTTPKFSTDLERKEKNGGHSTSSGSYTKTHKNTGCFPTDNSETTKIVSSNDRIPVYVGKEKEVDSDTHNYYSESPKEIGDRGEELILNTAKNYLLSEDNFLVKAPENNKGFDLYEKNQEGNIVRFIEVKTLTGKWGQGGVGITYSQLKFAQDQSEWWLFVVENINTNNTYVYQFKNPILEANKFMFDSSWKQLAYRSTEGIVKNTPQVGDKYDLGEDDKIYEVIKIEAKGKLCKVKLRALETLEIKTTKFNPSWTKL